MPVIQLPVSDTMDSVIRPISYSILKELYAELDLDEKDQRVLYLDESGQYRQYGSTIGHEDDENKGGVLFNAHDQMLIEVDETFVDNDAINQFSFQKNVYPNVFSDPNLGIAITPIYKTCELNIRFTKRFQDRHHALKWRDMMSYKLVNYTQHRLHNLTYHYLIPPTIMHILFKIHELRENQGGYGESFAEYVKKHTAVRLTTLSNLNGSKKALGISERQSRVLGTFDWDHAPEKGDKEENHTWSISFEYKVHYSRITHMSFAYPQVIHNQALPMAFVGDENYHQNKHMVPIGNVRGRLDTILLNYFSGDVETRAFWRTTGYSIPHDDEWLPPIVPHLTFRFYQVQVLFDPIDEEHDKTDLFKIDEVPDMEFDEDIKNHFKIEYPYMHLINESVYQINIYNQTNLLNNDHIRVDPDLYCYANFPINIRNNYHVRLGVYYDWTTLSKEAIERLKGVPRVVEKLLGHIGIDPKSTGVDFTKDRLTDEDMRKIIGATDTNDHSSRKSSTMQDGESLYGSAFTRIENMKSILTVVAHREDDL